MAEKKNLCAPISIELHAKVREEQERLGQTLSEYVEQVLKEHFEGRSKNMWIQQKICTEDTRVYQTSVG